MSRIVGLIGFSCSGKGTFTERVRHVESVTLISTGTAVRKEIESQGLAFTPENVLQVSDSIRARTGGIFLKILEPQLRNALQSAPLVIVDCFREAQDVSFAQSLCRDVKLLAIMADDTVRWARMNARGRPGDPKTTDDFLLFKQKERSLGVEELLKQANYSISNDLDIETFRIRSQEAIEKLLKDA